MFAFQQYFSFFSLLHPPNPFYSLSEIMGLKCIENASYVIREFFFQQKGVSDNKCITIAMCYIKACGTFSFFLSKHNIYGRGHIKRRAYNYVAFYMMFGYRKGRIDY